MAYTNPTPDLTITDVMARLCISRVQVHRLLSGGDLHAYRIGRRGIRIRTDSVEAFRSRGLDEMARQPASGEVAA